MLYHTGEFLPYPKSFPIKWPVWKEILFPITIPGCATLNRPTFMGQADYSDLNNNRLGVMQ